RQECLCHQISIYAGKRDVVSPAQRFQRIGGLVEKIGTGETGELAMSGEVRFEGEKAGVIAVFQIDENRFNLAIPLPGGNDFAIRHHRILDVDVNGIRLEQRPIVEWFFFALDEVSEIEGAAKLR